MTSSRIVAAVAGLAAALFPGSVSAADRTMAVVDGNALKRIKVDGHVDVIGRAQGATLVCVRYGGAAYWAKPEMWMTVAAAYDEHAPVKTGQVSGGGNGIGNLNQLPVLSPDQCT